ncbi:hypothetical protein MPSEU_000870000 [Mayamaea pseudoterrestris]|nr:hypothetical protein MPSEU_000870000 [Mayamaea pseudoterrestris]
MAFFLEDDEHDNDEGASSSENNEQQLQHDESSVSNMPQQQQAVLAIPSQDNEALRRYSTKSSDLSSSFLSSRHSDFTLPVSNRLLHNAPPPLQVNGATVMMNHNSHMPSHDASAGASTRSRRPIFCGKVQRKYDVAPALDNGLLWRSHNEHGSASNEQLHETNRLLNTDHHQDSIEQHPTEIMRSPFDLQHQHGSGANGIGNGGSSLTLHHEHQWNMDDDEQQYRATFDSTISPLASPTISLSGSSVRAATSAHEHSSKPKQRQSLLVHCVTTLCCRRSKRQENATDKHASENDAVPLTMTINDTCFQSLILALAVACVWTPSNLLAPNLTMVARDLHILVKRDLYLGSYCALASSVLSAPMGAYIGLLADVTVKRVTASGENEPTTSGYGSMQDGLAVDTNVRKQHVSRMTRHALFCWTIAGGGVTAWLTGSRWCTRYWQLLLLRVLNGGFMTGSVPIAFSIMADCFGSEQRNAASSGLTAMMGFGMIAGQIYAGMTGPPLGWKHGFRVSGVVTIAMAVLCYFLVKEPERGGKEKALQDMLQSGKRYERKLTWSRFVQSMRQNKSNAILIWQGFFSSMPWGIISVFLNDYLSQERGFSVADATFMVVCFGVGCAIGGILGGVIGQRIYDFRRSWLPLFMSATTMLGILPFICLLNTHFTNAHGPMGLFLTVSGGIIANLPSVNSRPCLINVNPPESRGAALTAANVLVNLGRGLGTSTVTLMVVIFEVDRQFAFNVTLIVFWSISALQLIFLSKTLAQDQDAMEGELAAYALTAMEKDEDEDDDESIKVAGVHASLACF